MTAIQEWIKEGREEGIRESARNMKAKGSSLDFIADVTGLSINEINDL